MARPWWEPEPEHRPRIVVTVDLTQLTRTARTTAKAWGRFETARLARLAAVRAAVAAGASQPAIARACGVTPQTVNKWLHGRRRVG